MMETAYIVVISLGLGLIMTSAIIYVIERFIK